MNCIVPAKWWYIFKSNNIGIFLTVMDGKSWTKMVDLELRSHFYREHYFVWFDCLTLYNFVQLFSEHALILILCVSL